MCLNIPDFISFFLVLYLLMFRSRIDKEIDQTNDQFPLGDVTEESEGWRNRHQGGRVR